MAILGNVKTPVTPKLSATFTFKKEPLALELRPPSASILNVEPLTNTEPVNWCVSSSVSPNILEPLIAD